MTTPTLPATRPDPRDLEVFHRTCPDCRKGIMWGRTRPKRRRDGTEIAGDWMPLDADPVGERGNVVAFRDTVRTRTLVVVVLGTPRDRRAALAAGYPLWQHHALSCHYADRWQRQRKHERPQPTGVHTAPTVQLVDTADDGGLF